MNVRLHCKKACVCLTQAGESSSERESWRRKEEGVWEFLSREGLNRWERGSAAGEEWKGEKEKGGGVTEED